MTISWLGIKGGDAHKRNDYWEMNWPDKKKDYPCTFFPSQMKDERTCLLLTPEDERIRILFARLPIFVKGSPIPIVSLKGLPDSIEGLWTLCEIQIQASNTDQMNLLRVPLSRRSFLSVFINNEGTIFLPTAQHIWDLLLSEMPQIHQYIEGKSAENLWRTAWDALEKSGSDIYQMLLRAQEESLIREEKRASIAFSAREKAINALGLPEVRNYRFARLEEEKKRWQAELAQAKKAVPEMNLLLIIVIGKE